MLWPEGAQSVVADLGSYLDPQVPDEKIRAFSLSKSGSFIAVASGKILALFRLSPLTPLAIYPTLFGDADITQISASTDGRFICVATSDAKIGVFKVEPDGDLEEKFRFTFPVTPGPGEAIGAHEIRLKPLDSLQLDFPVLRITAHGPFLFVLTAGGGMLAEWSSFGSSDTLHPPQIKKIVTSEDGNCLCGCIGPLSTDVFVVSLLFSDHILVRKYRGSACAELEIVSEETLESYGTACDYNPRLRSLAVCEKSAVAVYALDEPEMPSYEIPVACRYLRWSPSGTSLLVATKDGFCIYSKLGFLLHQNDQQLISADFFVSGGALALLTVSGELCIQQTLKLASHASSERHRPVLFGNSRLLLYGDARPASWFTIPLPTWYMASHAPLNYVASTSDGRFVALAGTQGIMLFSVSSKQWKEVGDRDSCVRGGLCWFGRRLIIANKSDETGLTALKMYSPAVNANTGRAKQASQVNFTENALKSSRRESASSLKLEEIETKTPSSALVSAKMLPAYSGFELQTLASETLGTNEECRVELLAKGPGSLLATVVKYQNSTRLFVYDLKAMDFALKTDMPLSEVVLGAYRQLAVVDESTVLVLVDTQLLLITALNECEFQKLDIASPIESFELTEDGLVCMFDGQEAVVTDLPNVNTPRLVASVGLDAYPVHFSAAAGTTAVVESAVVRSYDRSFGVSKLLLTHEVFVPAIIEAALSISLETAVDRAKRYQTASHFAASLETVVYKAVTSGKPVEPVLDLVKRFNLNFAGVVAGCARKIEAQFWEPLFFAAKSSPKEMFAQCLQSGDLETAAELLVVAQTFGAGETDTMERVLDDDLLGLYKAADLAHDHGICEQICAYLASIDRDLGLLKSLETKIGEGGVNTST